MTELLSQLPVSSLLQSVIGVAGIIVITVVSALLIRWFLLGLVQRLTERTSTEFDDQLLEAVRRPIYLLVNVIGLFVLSEFIESRTGETLGSLFVWIDGALWVFLVFLVALVLVKIATAGLAWYGATIASRTETTVDDEFIPLLDRGTKVIVYVLAALIVLDHFQVDIKGLIAVLGIGSLAIALAAQETIANMIGGFVIMIDRPFRPGDYVRLADGTVSVVHAIGIRSTKFWTFDNTLIIVPNAELMKSTVHNITYPFPRVRVVIDVGVSYSSDMGLVERVMTEEALNHPKVMKEPGASFFFLDFGDSSLDVSLRCHVDDVGDQFRTASDLRFMILNRFRQEGIEIPFPQRVVTTVGGTELPREAGTGAAASAKPVPSSTLRPTQPGSVQGGSVDIKDGN